MVLEKRINTARERVVRKDVVDFHINEDTMLETAKPVDFSFKNFKTLSSVGIVSARASRIGQTPPKTKTHKYLTRALWLNHNNLHSIMNMDAFVVSVLKDPTQLAWVDFSFNYISAIDDVITKYQNLKIIYFHGNKINNLDEVIKLKQLKNLRSLTFHGNPIAEDPHYRSFIISALPQLLNLDFVQILKTERLRPSHPDALKRLFSRVSDESKVHNKLKRFSEGTIEDEKRFLKENQGSQEDNMNYKES